MYYLFTNEDKCPEHMQPKDDRFPRSNIKDFMPQMEEDQGNDTSNSNDESNSNGTQQQQQQQQQQHQQQLRSEQLAQQNWFHSGDAWSLFMPNGTTKPTNDAACDVVVKSFIEARIAVCEEGIQDWTKAVRGAFKEDDINTTPNDKQVIKYKCRYILIALKYALENMGKVPRPTWRQCCENAISTMNNACDSYITCAKTIERWHRLFCDGNDQQRIRGESLVR